MFVSLDVDSVVKDDVCMCVQANANIYVTWIGTGGVAAAYQLHGITQYHAMCIC